MRLCIPDQRSRASSALVGESLNMTRTDSQDLYDLQRGYGL